jgi:hypothetical protein
MKWAIHIFTWAIFSVLCRMSQAHKVSLLTVNLFTSTSDQGLAASAGSVNRNNESCYRSHIRLEIENGGVEDWRLYLQLPSPKDRIVIRNGEPMIMSGAVILGPDIGDSKKTHNVYNDRKYPIKTAKEDVYLLGPLNWTKKIYEGGTLFIGYVATNRENLSVKEIQEKTMLDLKSLGNATYPYFKVPNPKRV